MYAKSIRRKCDGTDQASVFLSVRHLIRCCLRFETSFPFSLHHFDRQINWSAKHGKMFLMCQFRPAEYLSFNHRKIYIQFFRFKRCHLAIVALSYSPQQNIMRKDIVMRLQTFPACLKCLCLDCETYSGTWVRLHVRSSIWAVVDVWEGKAIEVYPIICSMRQME